MEEKENDLSFDHQPLPTTPQAKSTELINRRRQPLTNRLTDVSNPKMPDLSSLSDISTISELKFNDSSISVEAGHKETPRPDSFFSNAEPSWLASAERRTFDTVAAEEEAKRVTPLSRSLIKHADYVRGDYHAYRTPPTDQIDSSLEESTDETPVRATKKKMHSHSLFRSTDESSDSSQVTQISADELGITHLLHGMALSRISHNEAESTKIDHDQQQQQPVKEEAEIPKPSFPHVGDAIFANQIKQTSSFGSEDFLSESAGLAQLEEDEAEFDESNKFKLRDSDVNDEHHNETTLGSDKSNVTDYFRQSNASFGMGSMKSPEKDPEANFTVPSILQSTIGGVEQATFDVGTERRDTISTIKSMSLFETTNTNWDVVHQHLKKEDQSALSASNMERAEQCHVKARNKEESFDISMFDQHGSNRFSPESTFNIDKPPRSHSSPERSDDSGADSTKDRIKADFTFKPIATDDDDEEKMFKLEKPEFNSVFKRLETRQKSRPGSLGCPSVVSSGGYPQSVVSYPYPPPPPSVSSSAPYGYAQSQVALTEPLRPYSPVPLIDYPNLVDFRDPVFVEAIETNQLHLRLTAQLPWVRINLSFRSVKLGSSTTTEFNPFILRECDFILHANHAPYAVPIKFQPKKGGSYTALLEVQVGYHDLYNRPVSQTHTVNVIGKAIEPNISIGDNDDDIDIGCSSQLVPIYNHSEFDVPVMIEIDHGFTMTIQGHITNKIRIRAKTHVMCSIAPYNGGAGDGGNEQLGKLKVMLDRRDTPVVLKWKVLKKSMIVVDQIDLAGPLERIKLTGQIHQECSVRIPIRNLSTSSMASVNATIDGMYAESMSLAPETATVPPNGELVFSIKYTPGQNHQSSLEHKLIIEVSGAEREFVFAFFTVVEHKKLQHKTMDTIMANKSILIFDGVDQDTTKSVTVRGSGQFNVKTDDSAFQVARGVFNQHGQLALNGDKVMSIKYTAKNSHNILVSRMTLTSSTNQRTKSTIPLVAVHGKPSLSVNGVLAESGQHLVDRAELKLKNTGSGDIRVYLAQDDKTIDYCLAPNEEKVACLRVTKSSPVSLYLTSENMRRIVATVLRKESGRQTMKLVLQKAKSSKLVMFDFGMAPVAELPVDVAKNEKDILRAFLHSIAVTNCEMNKSIEKQQSSRQPSLGSIDSVPCKVMKPDFLLSTRKIDFGLVKPRSTHMRQIEMSNTESYDQSWLIKRKPTGLDMPNPYTLIETEGIIKSGQRHKIEVRFNPRKDGVYRQELVLEFHQRSLMGLARTIKKETILITGAAKTSEFKAVVNGKPSNRVEFTQEQMREARKAGETTVTQKIKFENRAKEPLTFTADKMGSPFITPSKEAIIKSRDIRFDWTGFFDSLIRDSSINETNSLLLDLSDEEESDFVELEQVPNDHS